MANQQHVESYLAEIAIRIAYIEQLNPRVDGEAVLPVARQLVRLLRASSPASERE